MSIFKRESLGFLTWILALGLAGVIRLRADLAFFVFIHLFLDNLTRVYITDPNYANIKYN